MKKALKLSLPLLFMAAIGFAGGIAYNKPKGILQQPGGGGYNINNAMVNEIEIKNLRKLYDDDCKKHGTYGKETKFITLSPGIFTFIAEYAAKNPTSLTGISLMMIRYDEKYKDKPTNPGDILIPGKKQPQQNSVVLVPVIDGKIDCKAWSPEVLKRNYPQYYKNKKAFFEGLNHGEICPDSCYSVSKK